VNLPAAAAAGVPLVRRFTGGGTVIVDENSILTSIIVHGPTAVPHVQPYPRPIMRWTESLYGNALGQHGAFMLRENGEFTSIDGLSCKFMV
jgi:lipoate-protein ligase A